MMGKTLESCLHVVGRKFFIVGSYRWLYWQNCKSKVCYKEPSNQCYKYVKTVYFGAHYLRLHQLCKIKVKVMDQRAFIFATRGQCIKGKQCQHITIKNQIFVCVQNNLAYFPFMHCPLVGNQNPFLWILTTSNSRSPTCNLSTNKTFSQIQQIYDKKVVQFCPVCYLLSLFSLSSFLQTCVICCVKRSEISENFPTQCLLCMISKANYGGCC